MPVQTLYRELRTLFPRWTERHLHQTIRRLSRHHREMVVRMPFTTRVSRMVVRDGVFAQEWRVVAHERYVWRASSGMLQRLILREDPRAFEAPRCRKAAKQAPELTPTNSSTSETSAAESVIVSCALPDVQLARKLLDTFAKYVAATANELPECREKAVLPLLDLSRMATDVAEALAQEIE